MTAVPARADRVVGGERGARRLAAALTALALLPVVVALITRTGRRYVPVGDIALIDLRVRDVWSRAIPLVGPYSRLGWNHPGPAMFWLIAPLSAVTGRPAWATLVGGVLIQATAIIAIGYYAWRKGGVPLVAAALAVNGLAYGAMGPSMLLEAWNPNVTYPFLLVILLQVWCLSDGDLGVLPATVAVATFLVQTHVGYLPLVAVALAFGLVGAWLRARRARSTSADASLDSAPAVSSFDRGRRAVLWSVVILVVSWAPAVAQEFVHGDNVAPFVRSLFGKGVRLGPHLAAGIFGAEFRVPPPWLGGHTHLDPFNNSVVPAPDRYLLVPIVLLVAAVFAAWRDARVRRPVALTALLAVVAYWSISRVVGGAERYAFFWRVPIAIVVVVVAVAAIGYWLGLDHRPAVARAALVLLVVVVASSSISYAVRTAQWGEVSPAEPVARAMLAQLQREHEPRGSVLVRAPDVPLLGLERTVVNELDRNGDTVRVDTDLGYQFGYTRTATPAEVDQVWYVVEGGQYLSLVTADPGARVLWSTAALPPAKELEMRRLQRTLWAQLQRAGRQEFLGSLNSPLLAFKLGGIPGVDQALVDRVAVLNNQAERAAPCRCAVVAFSPKDAPALTFP